MILLITKILLIYSNTQRLKIHPTWIKIHSKYVLYVAQKFNKNFWAICEPATGKSQLAEYLENYVYCILCSLGYSGICKYVRRILFMQNCTSTIYSYLESI